MIGKKFLNHNNLLVSRKIYKIKKKNEEWKIYIALILNIINIAFIYLYIIIKLINETTTKN